MRGGEYLFELGMNYCLVVAVRYCGYCCVAMEQTGDGFVSRMIKRDHRSMKKILINNERLDNIN
jgi:hypothetical protein